MTNKFCLQKIMFDNHSGDLNDTEANWGLGFMVHPVGTSFGRKNSASWGGLFNSYF